MLSLEDDINKANEDLKTILSEKSNYFILNAEMRLKDYIEGKLRGRHLTHYKKWTYNRDLRSNENPSKAIMTRTKTSRSVKPLNFWKIIEFIKNHWLN